MVKICIVPGACPVIIRMFLIIHANENPVIRADLSKGIEKVLLKEKAEAVLVREAAKAHIPAGIDASFSVKFVEQMNNTKDARLTPSGDGHALKSIPAIVLGE